MRIQITVGNGSLANCLKEYIDGDYYGKDMLDVTSRNCIRNLPAYDILIHTATGKKKINDEKSKEKNINILMYLKSI